MQNIWQSFFPVFSSQNAIFSNSSAHIIRQRFWLVSCTQYQPKTNYIFFPLSMFKMCCIEKVKRKQYQLLFLSLFYFNVCYFILNSGSCLLFYFFSLYFYFHFSFLCILFNFTVGFYFFILSCIYTFSLLLCGLSFWSFLFSHFDFYILLFIFWFYFLFSLFNHYNVILHV